MPSSNAADADLTTTLLVTHDEPAAPQASAGGLLDSLPMLVAIFLIFYFLVIRPQQQDQKRAQEMLAGLQKGDYVVTSSGLHGRIAEVQTDTLIVEIADKVRVTLDKGAVKRKLTPADPAGASATKGN